MAGPTTFVVAFTTCLPLDRALPLYRQMSKMLSDEVTYIPLYHTLNAFMVQPYVRGAGAMS